MFAEFETGVWYMTPSLTEKIPVISREDYVQLCDAIGDLEKLFSRETLPSPVPQAPKCAEDWRVAAETWKLFEKFLRSVEILQTAVDSMRAKENLPELVEHGVRNVGGTPSQCVRELRTKCEDFRKSLSIWRVTRHGSRKFPEDAIREIWEFIRETVSPSNGKAPPHEPDVVADVPAAHRAIDEVLRWCDEIESEAVRSDVATGLSPDLGSVSGQEDDLIEYDLETQPWHLPMPEVKDIRSSELKSLAEDIDVVIPAAISPLTPPVFGPSSTMTTRPVFSTDLPIVA